MPKLLRKDRLGCLWGCPLPQGEWDTGAVCGAAHSLWEHQGQEDVWVEGGHRDQNWAEASQTSTGHMCWGQGAGAGQGMLRVLQLQDTQS